MDILDLLIQFFSQFGYFAVFAILLLCGFGLPIPEDITLTASGIISGLGYTDVHLMFFVSMSGVLVGDSIIYLLGRRYGEKILQVSWIKKMLPPHRFKSVQEKFEKYGNGVVFAGRFMPGLRAGIFLMSGISRKISFTRFLMIDGFAAIISVPIWVYLGYYGAHKRKWLIEKVHEGQAGVLIALGLVIVAVLVVYFRKKMKKRSEKN